MQKWTSTASCRSPADQAAELAIIPGTRRRENRQTNKPQALSHQSRRVTAAMLDVTKFLRREETTCRSITISELSDSRLATRTGQSFHFFLVDFDFSGLLHLIAQVGNE